MTSTAQTPVATLWNPIPVAMHAQSELINEQAIAFVRNYAISRDDRYCDALARAGFGRLAAVWFPYADLERAQLTADFMGWGYVVDDLIDDPTTDRDLLVVRLHRLLRLLDAPLCPPLDDDPLALALVDLRTRLLALATPVQVHRVAVAWKQWFFGGVWQRAQREVGVGDLARVTAMRLYDVGMEAMTAWCEIAGNYRLASADLVAPPVRALTEMTGLLAAYDNDIFSLPKELTDQLADTSIITLCAMRRGGDTLQGLADTVDLRNQTMALFLRLREQTRRGASAALTQYLGDLGRVVAGSTHFWHTSPRYGEGVDARYAGLLGDVVVGGPDHGPDVGNAPPIPAIAWWWGCLHDRVWL